jgi:O-antigen/teichoic acid export membrane protein
MFSTGSRQLTHFLRAELRPDTQRGKLVRATAITGGQKAAAALLAFVASMVYARTLGAHGYGLYAYVSAWIAISTIPVAMGLPQYLIREGAKYRDRIPFLRRWADTRILISGTVALVAMACAALIPYAAGARWLFIIAAPVPLLAGLAAVRSALLQARGHVARSQWPTLLFAPGVTLAVFSVLALLRDGVSADDLMFVTLAASLLPLLINSLQLRRTADDSWTDAPLQATLRAAVPFMWVSGLLLLNSRVGLIILGAFNGAYDSGVYAIATKAADLTGFVMITGNLVLAPKLAELHHAGDRELLHGLVRRATRRMLVLSIPIALILGVGAESLLRAFYGDEFAGGAAILRILVIAQIITVASGPLGTLLNMTGHEAANAKSMLIAVALNVVLNFALIPQFGALGAAVAMAISMLGSRLLLWRAVRRNL